MGYGYSGASQLAGAQQTGHPVFDSDIIRGQSTWPRMIQWVSRESKPPAAEEELPACTTASSTPPEGQLPDTDDAGQFSRPGSQDKNSRALLASNRPTLFNGRRPSSWLVRMELFLEGAGVPEKDKVWVALTYLDSRRLDWYTTVLSPDRRPRCWEDFKKTLRNHFSSYTAYEARTRLKGVKQSGTVQEYVTSFAEAASECPDLPEDAKRDLFVSNLRTDISALVADGKLANMDEAVLKARRMEAVLAQRPSLGKNMRAEESSGPRSYRSWRCDTKAFPRNGWWSKTQSIPPRTTSGLPGRLREDGRWNLRWCSGAVVGGCYACRRPFARTSSLERATWRQPRTAASFRTAGEARLRPHIRYETRRAAASRSFFANREGSVLPLWRGRPTKQVAVRRQREQLTATEGPLRRKDRRKLEGAPAPRRVLEGWLPELGRESIRSHVKQSGIGCPGSVWRRGTGLLTSAELHRADKGRPRGGGERRLEG